MFSLSICQPLSFRQWSVMFVHLFRNVHLVFLIQSRMTSICSLCLVIIANIKELVCLFSSLLPLTPFAIPSPLPKRCSASGILTWKRHCQFSFVHVTNSMLQHLCNISKQRKCNNDGKGTLGLATRLLSTNNYSCNSLTTIPSINSTK